MAGCTADFLFLETQPFLFRRIATLFNTFRGVWLDSHLTFLIFPSFHIRFSAHSSRVQGRDGKGHRAEFTLSFTQRPRHGVRSAGQPSQVPATHCQLLGASSSPRWAVLLRGEGSSGGHSSVYWQSEKSARDDGILAFVSAWKRGHK